MTGAEKTVSVVSFANSQLTPHAFDMLGPRDVVPYREAPFFKTAGSSDLPSRQARGQPLNAGDLINPKIKTITTTNIQLSGIPDKLIICARNVIGNMKPTKRTTTRL